nr:pyruvate kinase [Clostridium sp. AM45-5]
MPARIELPDITIPYLIPGQEILLDDGKIHLKVVENSENRKLGSGEKRRYFAKVLWGGLLKSRKSAAFPGAKINSPTLTKADLENIRLAKEMGVTGVMQPFVRGREDLECVKNALKEAGAEDVKLFAKIENLDGVRKLEELIPEADEIVIARGDLGNAVHLWDLPSVQREISQKCLVTGKPFMVVTQMLASMERNPVPTRAEVNDIFHAVLDGASSVMVTGETAAGDYPVEVIRYLVNTVRSAEKIIRG